MHWATGIPTTAISSPLPSRRDIYIYIYNACSSFAIRGARDGAEKVTKPCVSRKTLDLPGIRHSRID